jgi:hypothetical protein
MQNEEERGANSNNNIGYYLESTNLEDKIIFISHMSFEWTQDDRLSKICKNASNTNGKMVVDVKIITTKVNVMDVNVVIRSKCSKNKNQEKIKLLYTREKRIN